MCAATFVVPALAVSVQFVVVPAWTQYLRQCWIIPSPAVGYAVPLLQSVLRQLPYWSSLSSSAVSVHELSSGCRRAACSTLIGCEQREGLARLPERLRAIELSVAAVSNSVDQQREPCIDAWLKTVEVFLAIANPPVDDSAQERFRADEDTSSCKRVHMRQRQS